MNKDELAKRADVLRNELDRAALLRPQAALLREALQELLQDALAKRITVELEWDDVPGDWFFLEEGLDADAQLEDAFANFKLFATGTQPPPP